MGIFGFGSAEEGVQEAGFAYIAAAEEGYFGVCTGRERAEVGCGVEKGRRGGVEEVVRIFELGVIGR